MIVLVIGDEVKVAELVQRALTEETSRSMLRMMAAPASTSP
jgi:hypothetical protein